MRRQTGGRPGFVYGADGAPLVVPLDAMAEDLKAAGCGPGAYRLDAVDEKGKPVGATAFTQLEPDPSAVAETAARPAAAGDALVGAVDGMVRVMEAMQKAQAERDKATAQVMLALVERAGGVKSGELMSAFRQAAQLEDALQEAFERRQERIQAATPEPLVVTAPTEATEKPMTTKILEFVSAIADVGNKLGINIAEDVPKWIKAAAASEHAAPSETPIATPTPTVAPPVAQAQPAETSKADVDELPLQKISSPAAREKFQAVWAQLSDEERRAARELIGTMPAGVMKRVEAGLAAMSVDEAVAYLRKQFAPPSTAPPRAATGGSG